MQNTSQITILAPFKIKGSRGTCGLTVHEASHKRQGSACNQDEKKGSDAGLNICLQYGEALLTACGFSAPLSAAKAWKMDLPSSVQVHVLFSPTGQHCLYLHTHMRKVVFKLAWLRTHASTVAHPRLNTHAPRKSTHWQVAGPKNQPKYG